MKEPQAVLLRKSTEFLYQVRAELQEGRWVEFTYSEKVMAREHYYFLQNTGLIGGYAIKSITFHEIDKKTKKNAN